MKEIMNVANFLLNYLIGAVFILTALGVTSMPGEVRNALIAALAMSIGTLYLKVEL